MRSGQSGYELFYGGFMRVRDLVWISARRFCLAAALLGIFALVPGALAKKNAYNFKFGLMTYGANGEPVVYLETTEIEKHADPAYSHGFSVKRKDGAQFFIYFKVRFPEPLKNIPEAVHQHYSVLENGRVFQSKEQFVWESTQNFVFDKSDPIGRYEMEILGRRALPESGLQCFAGPRVRLLACAS